MFRKNTVWDRAKADKAKQREETAESQTRKAVLANIGVKRWVPYAILVVQTLILYFIFNPLTTYTPPKATDLNETGKQTAWAQVEDWLSDADPLGAQGEVVSWDGAKTTTVDMGSDKKTTAYEHQLTVHTAYGWWKVVCTVLKDGSTIGYPSATRLDVDPQQADSADWNDALSDLSPSDAMERLMTSFGDALVGYDSDKLTVVVSDSDPDAKYPVLGLGAAKDVKIDKASYLKSGHVDKDSETSDLAALRITITVAGRTQDASDTMLSYDVKVSDPDGTPKILAWGAPGTGDRLKKGANRWKGDTSEMPDYESSNKQADAKLTQTGSTTGTQDDGSSDEGQ